MDTKALKCFITLYRLQNMHKAAEELYISQQGLSKMIQNLESEWEALLFERSRYGMRPTKAGECFYQHAVSLQSELDMMKKEIQNAAAGKEELCIACAYGTLHILYPYIQRFKKENPSVCVKWKEYTDRETDYALRSGDVELAFCVEGDGQEDFICTHLFEKTIMLLVYQGHSLWEKEKVTISDLKGEKIIIEGEGFHIFSAFQRKCLEAGFYPEILAETAEINLCQNLCMMGEGLSISVDFVVEKSRMQGVKAIPFTDPGFTWKVSMARKEKRELTSTARKFVKFMQEADLTEGEQKNVVR